MNSFHLVGVEESTLHDPRLKYANVIGVPAIYLPYMNDPRPYQIMRGSRFSAKSYTKAIFELLKCRGDQYYRGVFARHTQKAAKKSQFQLFEDTLKRYPLLGQEFETSKHEMIIKHKATGHFMRGGSFEQPEDLMSVPDVTDFWAEEPITRTKSIDKQAFLDIAGTLRNSEGVPPRFHFTFNCIGKENFIYEDFFSDNKVYDATQFSDLLVNYGDNPFCPQDRIDFLDQMKKSDPKRYLVDGLGHWGEPTTGDEYHHNFDYVKHTGLFGMRSDLPLHITFDFNSNPYMTLQVWQIVYPDFGVPEFRCLKAYSNKAPFNNIESTCDRFIADFEDVVRRNGLYIYGDSSGKNKLPFRDKKNFYEVITSSIKYASRDRIRLLSKNPLHIKRRSFLNKLLFDEKPFKVIFHEVHAKDAINDIKIAKTDANSGLLKEKETKNGITYEKVGHQADAWSGLAMWHLTKQYGFR